MTRTGQRNPGRGPPPWPRNAALHSVSSKAPKRWPNFRRIFCSNAKSLVIVAETNVGATHNEHQAELPSLGFSCMAGELAEHRTQMSILCRFMPVGFHARDSPHAVKSNEGCGCERQMCVTNI